MGYEAYKLTAKFENLSLDDMIAALTENGAALVEKFGGTVTMEKIVAAGIIELVLRENSHVNTRFSPGGKILVSIRFAKVSDTHITGEVMALIKTLTSKFDVIYIMDCETNMALDINNAARLMKAVTYAKYDFEYYFPVRRRHVRCRDVFCLCANDYQQPAAERISL